MKKEKYLVPEMDVLSLEPGSTFICHSGENLDKEQENVNPF